MARLLALKLHLLPKKKKKEMGKPKYKHTRQHPHTRTRARTHWYPSPTGYPPLSYALNWHSYYLFMHGKLILICWFLAWASPTCHTHIGQNAGDTHAHSYTCTPAHLSMQRYILAAALWHSRWLCFVNNASGTAVCILIYILALKSWKNWSLFVYFLRFSCSWCLILKN